jgi:hypothetical protein
MAVCGAVVEVADAFEEVCKSECECKGGCKRWMQRLGARWVQVWVQVEVGDDFAGRVARSLIHSRRPAVKSSRGHSVSEAKRA